MRSSGSCRLPALKTKIATTRRRGTIAEGDAQGGAYLGHGVPEQSARHLLSGIDPVLFGFVWKEVAARVARARACPGSRVRCR